MKKIVIIDGQGGRLGKLLVEETRARMPQAHILVIGTNGVATSTMQKAGADPVVRGVQDADAVLGPMGIVVSDAILGEVTPVMAQAVGSCRARKFLVPMNSCGVWVAGTQEMGLAGYVKLVVEEATRYLEEEDA